ncbi:MAG: type II toxin-antitoxin system VapC family toxin [Candidatus Saccharibacteria bacterium]|nr:type II toxin-antitoxin system VapC family toxin [Candidatus Saccharibacteria bacterium]
MKYMLDTNICIYIMEHRDSKTLEKLFALNHDNTCTSTIVYGELAFGAEKSNRKVYSSFAQELFLNSITVLPVTPAVAKEYGAIRAKLEKNGTPIGPNDLWIAAHAKSLGLTLITNNEKEFKRIKGLKVENWAH